MAARLLPILGLVWFVSELCVTQCCAERPSKPPVAFKDRRSLSVIAWATVVSLGGGIVVAYHFPCYDLPTRHLFLIIGVVFVVGLALRLGSILYLGRFFTGKVAIATDHRLVDSGPYRFVRHPSYTGALLLVFGLGLGIGNWLSLAVVIAPVFIAFWWRMRIEEAALAEALGDRYRRYMERTKRLIPMIY